MGIPHLTAQIRPYATPIMWHSNAKGTEGSSLQSMDNLVIDGPSLAYHIYYQCLANKTEPRNTLAAIPSYAELGKAVVLWLEEMETFGLQVKHIFFDGHLPKSKSNTRYDRLSKYLLRLKAYRSSTDKLSASGESFHKVKNQRASNTQAPSRPTDIPAPPFLVPCVMDALFASKYDSRTHSVPCEAEVQCTSSDSLVAGDIILTSDSDLILLAKSNRVIFFNEIDIRSEFEDCDTCFALYYDAAEISAKLECSDLIKLAFLLTLNPNRLLKELAKQATQGSMLAGYEEFRTQFLPENQYPRSHFTYSIGKPNQMKDVLRRLDPRVAELVQQWGSDLEGTEAPAQNAALARTSISPAAWHMFLPFLIDDPTRASAWKPSQAPRTLAYSILAQSYPSVKMMEVDRRGDRMIGTHVPLLEDASAIAETCWKLERELSEPRTQGSLAQNWRLVALHQVLDSVQNERVSLPSRRVVRETCSSSWTGKEWVHVHLSAQVEGYLYSLRILSQILEVFLATDLCDAPVIRNKTRSLLQTLRGLPTLDALIHRTADGLALDESCSKNLDDVLVVWFGDEDEEPAEDEILTTGKHKKKRAKTTGKGTGRQAGFAASGISNMFNLLNEM